MLLNPSIFLSWAQLATISAYTTNLSTTPQATTSVDITTQLQVFELSASSCSDVLELYCDGRCPCYNSQKIQGTYYIQRGPWCGEYDVYVKEGYVTKFLYYDYRDRKWQIHSKPCNHSSTNPSELYSVEVGLKCPQYVITWSDPCYFTSVEAPLSPNITEEDEGGFQWWHGLIIFAAVLIVIFVSRNRHQILQAVFRRNQALCDLPTEACHASMERPAEVQDPPNYAEALQMD